jgi:hypothetical protein
VKSSDLDYYTPRPRAGGKLENGIDHITRNHILLDGSDEQILTPSKLPMLAQSKSKYLFQDGTTLSEAQKSVMHFNAFLFDAAIKTGNYTVQGNGYVVMSIRFTAPVVDNTGKIYAGIGYDKEAGWLPTMRAKLVLGRDCKGVVTSYPGQ